MNLQQLSLMSAIAVATFGVGCAATSIGPSQGEPTAQKKIAFHVIGLMKTKSGAT